jgi:hypothetical protein
MPTLAATTRPWALDRARAALYRSLAPWLGGLYADRPRRVAWLGVTSVLTSLALTCAAPLWLLALGPVLLGVPHLVADARYLVVRPGVHRAGALPWLGVVPLVAAGFGAPPAVCLLVMLPLALSARGPAWRTTVVLGAWALLTALAWAWELPFLYAFLHLHNLVALAWWWAFRPRDARAWWVVVVVAMGTALLLGGAAEPVLALVGGWNAPASGTSFTEFVTTTAPFLEGRWALRLVLAFAFLQSVHYALWLRLIPDDARERPAPRPFRHTWQALEVDFGRPLLVACCGLALLIAGWGLIDLAAARHGYLRLAAFHGYLELGAAAYFLAAGRRPTAC